MRNYEIALASIQTLENARNSHYAKNGKMRGRLIIDLSNSIKSALGQP